MTSYCSNLLIVKGDSKKELELFYKANYQHKHQVLSFENLVPIIHNKKYGEVLTQSDCGEFWGTKWEAMDFETTALGQDSLIYKFYTAQTPPTTWLHKVAKIYPSMLFELEYSNSETNFWGKQIYEKGWMIDEEYEPLGERNWRLCNKEILEKHIDNSMDLITKENYPLRIHNIVDDYAFEAANHKNIEPYVEHMVKQKLGLI